MALTGSDTGARYQLYRYEAAGEALDCVSCIPTGSRPSTNTFPSAYGSSITDDGRVFFTSAEPLTLRDSNEKKDAYEWSEGQSAADLNRHQRQ